MESGTPSSFFWEWSRLKLRGVKSSLCGMGLALCGTVGYTSGTGDVILAVVSQNTSHVDHVKTYIVQQRDDDPLMEIEPGAWVKTSHVRGVKVGKTTYYYNISPHMSFDPVSRGLVSPSMIDIVYEDEDSDVPYIIYKLR